MKLCDSVCDSVELALFMLVYLILQVFPYYRFVRRNNDYVHVVNISELVFFCLGCTGHSGKLFVHTEVVLDSDRRQCL